MGTRRKLERRVRGSQDYGRTVREMALKME